MGEDSSYPLPIPRILFILSNSIAAGLAFAFSTRTTTFSAWPTFARPTGLTRTATFAARPSFARPTGSAHRPTLLHLLQHLLLIVGQNLFELLVEFLLQLGELLFLVGG